MCLFILVLMGMCQADSDHLFPTSHSEMSHQYLELGHSENIYTMGISKGYRSGLSWKWEE